MQSPLLPHGFPQGFHRRLALPLGLQLLAILVGSLVVAQLVTLALTVAIPPEPVQRWDLDQVASRLSGRGEGGLLERRRMAGPPDIGGPGWLVSASSREALARKLNRPVDDIVLAFYTQLPVGGVTVPVNDSRAPLGAADGLPWLVGTAHAQGMPGGPPPGGMPGGGVPGGGFPGGGFPGGGMPGSRAPGGMPGGVRGPGGGVPQTRAPAPSTPSRQPGAAIPRSAGGAPDAPARQPGAAGPSQMSGPPGGGAPMIKPVPPSIAIPTIPQPVIPRPIPTPTARPEPEERTVAAPRPSPVATQSPASVTVATPNQALPSPAAVAIPRTAAVAVTGTPQPIPFRQPAGLLSGGLLSFASPPFIEGDFIAALRQPEGSWIAVAPRAEPFPNRWQQRVMLWFALSLLIVAPFAWAFARRIVKPLERFAQTAELLGRDPAASVLPLSGPAEVGRAARAFNVMHTRLRAFVDDRTAMIGAISHDLRTPLTRLRFRLEDVPDEQRDALLREVDEMEQMIGQVIGFIRDASTPGPRERIDFAALVESSVADAKVLGGKIEIEAVEHGLVEVDPLGMRRLLGNLLENALKYGETARVRVSLRDRQAVAEIIDDGPGIPAEEYDQAFDPFYRSAQARESGKPGSGLGLAVCRSIARAHGGDVRLEQRSEGFVASVAVPLSFDDRLPRAA